jgi:hypothetical protein
MLFPELKWEVVSMDFIVRLSLTEGRHDSIFMLAETLTKSAHFILVRMMFQVPYIARFFIRNIVRFHGVPKRIISDRESMFIGSFWTSFQEALGTHLNFSTEYNPEIEGKIERMNQIFEFMLHTYVMDEQKCREEFLPLVEFAYNNNYQSTIKMVSFEFLYGRLCQTPFSWDRLEDRVLVGPETIQEMEKQMKMIRKMIK